MSSVRIRRELSHSLWIAWKDLLEFRRNRMGLVMLALMPVFMMVMTGFIFPSGNVLNRVPVALVNLDEGLEGLNIVSQLETINEESGLMELLSADSFDETKRMIFNGEAVGGIVVPEGFSSALSNGEQGTIIVFTDQSNPQISATLSTVLEEIIDGIGTMRAAAVVAGLAQQANTTLNPLAVVVPYAVESRGVVEGSTSYFDFVAPGIMAMVVMLSVMTGLPRAISYEKDIGTLDGFLVAPISRLSIILGKVLAQTTRGLVQGIMVMVLAYVLFGVTIHGSILLVFILLFIGVFSFVGLGILLTSVASDEQTAMMMMSTLMFPMMFLSGVFFPIQQMPPIMQGIASILPLTYATGALRKVMVLGAGLENVWTELVVLIGFGVVLLAIAVPVFRRAMTR